MVVRLEGKVQGQDVIFEHVQGDDWEAVIPPTLNGIYIVSLTAWDDAGNAAYTTLGGRPALELLCTIMSRG